MMSIALEQEKQLEITLYHWYYAADAKHFYYSDDFPPARLKQNANDRPFHFQDGPLLALNMMTQNELDHILVIVYHCLGIHGAPLKSEIRKWIDWSDASQRRRYFYPLTRPGEEISDAAFADFLRLSKQLLIGLCYDARLIQMMRNGRNGKTEQYRASESATNNMANSYLEIVNQRSLLQGQLDTLTANCSTCDANVIAQADIVSDLQGKLDAALSQGPPADEATQTWYRLELEKEQSRLQTLQSAQSEAYAARDAFLATGALDAQNAAVEQAFHEYEAQYASYLAARQRMIDAQNSVGLTQVAFPHDSEPPDPSILPR